MNKRQRLKPWVERFGLENVLKKSFTEGMRSGEFLKFLFSGRPDPSKAILLVGSGRSGTSWTSALIAACPGIQAIYEPLHPLFTPEIRHLTGWELTVHKNQNRSYYLRANAAHPDRYALLEKMLTGRVRNYFTDYERNSYFPSRFVIKLIRANLMLGYIYDNFHLQIIYITRHPCAVVSSRLKLQWYANVADILYQEELVEDFLRPWVKAIEQEKDPVGAHAVWWAVENRVASLELETRPHYPMTYESLCLEPEQQALQMFSWLGIPCHAISESVLERTSRISFHKSKMDRLSSWQHQLTATEQRRILDWAHRLGVTAYNDQILPIAMQDKDSR